MSPNYRAMLPLSISGTFACLVLGVTVPLACAAGGAATKGSGGNDSGSGTASGGAGSGTLSAGSAAGGKSAGSGGGTSTGSTVTSASNGTTTTGASSATSAVSSTVSTGTNATAGTGGGAGTGVTSSQATSGAGGGGVCNALTIVPMPVTPTVLLLVDTSSSMFQGTMPWNSLYNALMDPTTGVVKGLQDKVRFGFTSYNSVTLPVLDPTCPKLQSVDFALNNYDAINTAYTAAGAAYGTGGNIKWETPTGESVAAVAKTLTAYDPTPAGPKYILLVTDGNPDTCAHRDPQCGQDSSIKAVQDAYAAGIGTFIIGIGDILTDNSGCVGRCGVDHLQDVANAGTGQPVMANSLEYSYSACVGNASNLTATYSAAGGTAKYFTATDQAALQTAISGLLNSVVSCSFEMNAIVTGDASLGQVTVGTTREVYNDPNGWKLESNNYTVTLQGTACDAFKAGGVNVDINFPCDNGMPITMGR